MSIMVEMWNSWRGGEKKARWREYSYKAFYSSVSQYVSTYVDMQRNVLSIFEAPLLLFVFTVSIANLCDLCAFPFLLFFKARERERKKIFKLHFYDSCPHGYDSLLFAFSSEGREAKLKRVYCILMIKGLRP
jgi:hypothetical protein